MVALARLAICPATYLASGPALATMPESTDDWNGSPRKYSPGSD
jgi:hypothetical protein